MVSAGTCFKASSITGSAEYLNEWDVLVGIILQLRGTYYIILPATQSGHQDSPVAGSLDPENKTNSGFWSDSKSAIVFLKAS